MDVTLDIIQPKQQTVLRSCYATTDYIYVIYQIVKIYQEYNEPLHDMYLTLLHMA